MPNANFLDTNILIYAAAGAKNEPRKRSISAGLFRDPYAIISSQVMAEFYWNTIKKEYLDVATAARWLDTLSMMTVVDVTGDLVVRGAALARRYQISYWDAALIAASQRGGADVLYTEDLNHGQLYDGVRVVNPFKEH